LSLVILTILIVIGACMIVTHYRYNPAVLQRNAVLPPTDKDSPAAPLPSNESFIPLPRGLTPLTATEIFEAHNLSDKINGKAELYLSADFTRLTSQRFKDKNGTNLWIEAYVYDMGNGQNAYAVFSAQRREDAEALDLTQYSYGTPNALFLVHGRYYVELIASEASKRATQPMKMLAAAFIRNTRTELTVTFNEMKLFPQQDLVADSITLISSDAFGFEGLDKVYTAEYVVDDSVFMAYLARRKTSDEAEKLAMAYRKFLVTYGGQIIETKLPIKDAQLVEILDNYEINFSQGPYLAGIREAATLEQAKKMSIRLYNRIKEVSGEY